eukprot:Em0020g1032a
MQPLDIAVYRALRIFFEQEISAFQKQHIGRMIKQHDIAKLLTPAYLKAASAQNAVSGFKTPGIWPYNSSVFGDGLCSCINNGSLWKCYFTCRPTRNYYHEADQIWHLKQTQGDRYLYLRQEETRHHHMRQKEEMKCHHLRQTQ